MGGSIWFPSVIPSLNVTTESFQYFRQYMGPGPNGTRAQTGPGPKWASGPGPKWDPGPNLSVVDA